MNVIEQYKRQHDAVERYVKYSIEDGSMDLDFYQAYGKYPCLRVTVGAYLFEMEFKPQDNPARNQIRTRVYFTYTDQGGISRISGFMLKRGEVIPELKVFSKSKSDYYFLPTTMATWADDMIGAVEFIKADPDRFTQMCRASCPFNDDGTNKYKCWKNFAKVRITRQEDAPLIQGLKGGERPGGSHVVGSNGSFRVFNKGLYCIEYVVEVLSGEKPLRQQVFYVETEAPLIDSFLRALKERLGREKMPYDLLNPRLPERLEVVTYDMDKDPEDREFFPVEYGGSWLALLRACLRDFLV